jgi:hypothetical protein
MTQVFFLIVLVLAFGLFAFLRVMGVGVKFGPIFKMLATAFAMLPVLVMSALVIFAMEVGACMAILLILQVTGIFPDLSGIPHRYEVFGIWTLTAIAIVLAGINWLRYIVLVRND